MDPYIVQMKQIYYFILIMLELHFKEELGVMVINRTELFWILDFLPNKAFSKLIERKWIILSRAMVKKAWWSIPNRIIWPIHDKASQAQNKMGEKNQCVCVSTCVWEYACACARNTAPSEELFFGLRIVLPISLV